VAAGVLAGCGSAGTNNGAAVKVQSAAVEQTEAELTIVAPAEGETVHADAVTVRGTVSPEDAKVKVLGKTAQVDDGAFTATVKLPSGTTSIDVVATASDADPGTATVSVERAKTAKQIAAERARERRERQAAERREAAERARKRAAARTNVPDLVGERLDVAEDDLESRGLAFAEIGGGTFGIVVPSNWTVCETRPGAGASISKHGRVKLIVDRSC
jgi:hypothetical protein